MLSNKPKPIVKPMAVGSTSVKMPKAKTMADPFGKKSLFFKSENIKNSSVRKLHDFLMLKNIKWKK